jgi:hypothetical protein
MRSVRARRTRAVRSVGMRAATTTGLAIGVMALAVLAAGCAHKGSMAPPIEAAATLLVNLDARDASAGTAIWKNTAPASIGDFTAVGEPSRTMVGGVAAVELDGATTVYRGPLTNAMLEGAHARTVEVWAYNPSSEPDEETMVAWGRRGTNLNNFAFNWGSNATWGALTAYGTEMDMGWDVFPSTGAWRHLVLVYDGTNVNLYDNAVSRGAQEYSGETALQTAAGCHINIGAQNDAENADPIFESEFFAGQPLAFSGYVALVRIHGAALTAEQVKTNYNAEAARFGLAVAE